MSKYRKSRWLEGILLFIAINAVIIRQSYARFQDPPPPFLIITLDAQVIDTDVFYLSDTSFKLQNIATSSRGPILFSVHITSDRHLEVIFGIEIIADVDVIGSPVEIYKGFTKPVTLEANRGRFFSSRDLSRGGVLELYDDETIDISRSDSATKRLIDVIRATSRLPDGTYIVRITTYRPGQTSTPLESVERHLKIINPTRVDLLSPFDGDRLFTQFPLFQWRSDTRTVILRVFEMRSEIQTREEAITGIPHLEKRIDNSQNQFFYPHSGTGIRNLQPGKSYVWFIEGIYRTSANTEETIPSEIFTFSIIDPHRESVIDAFILQLEQAFEGNYDDILEEITQRSLQSIDEFYLDDSQITQYEFNTIINALKKRKNNAEIRNVEIK